MHTFCARGIAKMKNMKKRITVTINAQLYSIIEEEAIRKETSMSHVVEECIETCVMLRKIAFRKLRDILSDRETEALREVSRRIIEKPVSHKIIEEELRSLVEADKLTSKLAKELMEKLSKLSQCELNLIIPIL